MAGYPPELSAAGDDAGFGDNSLSLRTVWMAVLRRWWVVIVVFIVVVSLGIWRTLSEQPLYRAVATVRVSQQQAPIQGMQSPQGYQDYRVDRLLTETRVIGSAEVAKRVVHALGLQLWIVRPPNLPRIDVFGTTIPRVGPTALLGEYSLKLADTSYTLASRGVDLASARYGDSVSVNDIALTIPRRPAIEEREVGLRVIPLGDAAGMVSGSIGTQVLDKTDIIEISATMPERYMAMDVTNAVAREYADFSKEAVANQAKSKAAFIKEQLDIQERRLSAAQNDRKRFLEINGLTDLTSEQAALSERIYDLEAQRQEAMLERDNYRAVQGELGAADTTTEKLRRLVGTGAVATNAAVADLYSKWFELSSARQEMVDRRNLENTELARVDSQIAVTKRNLQTAVNDYFLQLGQRITNIEAQIATLRKGSERFPTLAADEARLLAAERTLTKIYDDLQAQYQLARISEAVDVAVVRPIDSASLPFAPVSPNRRQDAMLAAALGLLLGVAVAVGLDRMDDSVRSPDDIAEQLNLPVLGMIPAIKVDADGRTAPSVTMERLVTHANPRSPVAEAYRSLRTNLAFARAREEVKTLVLTSPGPADGKSTTVANLAITFAQQGQRTLLVDADLRRAVLDKTFSVPRSPGLTEVIVGEAQLSTAVNATAVPNLFVLGSGHFPPNPSELLGSAAMRNVLREAKEQFEVILFDSPPLLAVTDAAVLATMVDGTVLVVRMGATARGAVRRALGQLQAVHGRVLGSVMNDVDLRKSSYYGGYGYAYYAYYGSEANGNGNGGGIVGRLKRFGARATSGTR
jgi:capsular exopolysaccharide synthesis family protein